MWRWDERVGRSESRSENVWPMLSGGAACCQRSGAWEERSLTKVWLISIHSNWSMETAFQLITYEAKSKNLKGLFLALSSVRKHRPQQSLLTWQEWLHSGQTSSPVKDAPQVLKKINEPHVGEELRPEVTAQHPSQATLQPSILLVGWWSALSTSLPAFWVSFPLLWLLTEALTAPPTQRWATGPLVSKIFYEERPILLSKLCQSSIIWWWIPGNLHRAKPG